MASVPVPRYALRVAYDQTLAARVRACLSKRRGVVEKKMMGRLAFMVAESMACAVGPEGLLVRVLPEERDSMLDKAHVTAMEMRGRTMQGFVRVATNGLRTDAALATWVQRGIEAGAAKKKKPARPPKAVGPPRRS